MPRYHFPLAIVLPRVPSFLLGQRRSLLADFQLLLDRINAQPCVIGAEHIPPHESFILVMNHFHRRDIAAWWPAMATFVAVAKQRAGHAAGEVRLIMASQWTYQTAIEKALIEPAARFAIGRVAHAYDFLLMEPTALGTARSAQRAQSMRNIMDAAKQAARDARPIALAPEGGDSPDGTLMQPPAGAGRFMLLLATTGLPFLPVGQYAQDDQLVSHFGERFQLRAPAAMSKKELDEWAAREVMTRIARLLPSELRGAYQDA